MFQLLDATQVRATNADMSGARVGQTNSHVLTKILITVQPVGVRSTKVREAELAKMCRLYLNV